MPWLTKYKFLTRLIIIYLVHIIFKGFDYSFGGFFDFKLRGILYSLYFISVWLIAWYLIEYLNKKLPSSKQLLKLIINIIYGFVFGFITNWGYR